MKRYLRPGRAGRMKPVSEEFTGQWILAKQVMKATEPAACACGQIYLW